MGMLYTVYYNMGMLNSLPLHSTITTLFHFAIGHASKVMILDAPYTFRSLTPINIPRRPEDPACYPASQPLQAKQLVLKDGKK